MYDVKNDQQMITGKKFGWEKLKKNNYGQKFWKKKMLVTNLGVNFFFYKKCFDQILIFFIYKLNESISGCMMAAIDGSGGG